MAITNINSAQPVQPISSLNGIFKTQKEVQKLINLLKKLERNDNQNFRHALSLILKIPQEQRSFFYTQYNKA